MGLMSVYFSPTSNIKQFFIARGKYAFQPYLDSYLIYILNGKYNFKLNFIEGFIFNDTTSYHIIFVYPMILHYNKNKITL